MYLRSLAILLLCSLAVGQAAPSPSAKPAEKPSSKAAADKTDKDAAASSSVAPSAAVITIDGVCDTPATPAKTGASAKPKAACKTVITRAQFEDLANALQPNMNPAMKKRLADVYPKMLVMAYEARKRGLESDPKYKQVLQFARLQILSQELSKSLKEESDKVPEADIEKYYKDNAPAFQQADLKRLFVPKDKQSDTGENAAEEADESQPEQKSAQKADQKPADQTKTAETQKTADQKKVDAEAQKKADEESMKKEADTIHTRAAAGEDFDKLQKEAFEAASIKGTPPSTSIGKLTSNEVPVNHRAVLDLKPGDVSEIITEPNGYYIYKVVARGTKPLDQARDQIRATLAQQKMQDTVQKIQDEAKTSLNEAYFAAAPAMPGMPGMSGPGAHPMGSGGGMRMPGGAAPPASSAKPAESGQTTPSTPPAPQN